MTSAQRHRNPRDTGTVTQPADADGEVPLLAALRVAGGLRSVYQPIVELATGDVVGFEALARGPAGGDLERPDQLFAAARQAGALAELDWACRIGALAGAEHGGLSHPLTLFINVEPAALGGAPPPGFTALADRLAGRVPVVIEFTERALATDPARLLAAVEWIRNVGWGVAVDDIGAEPASLALMPFLAPDVLKLDLRLIQERATVGVAEVVHAVNAQAERTGALVLAEGIETPDQAELARAMGARLGQGWLYGRPGPLPRLTAVPGAGRQEPGIGLLPSASWLRTDTPYQLVSKSRAIQRSTKPLLIAMSKLLEQQALALGAPAVVLATFQHASFFTPATARRYAALADSAELVVALGEAMPEQPGDGVTGVAFDRTDPLAGEWDLVVVGPHFAAALLARDIGDGGVDAERRFDYVVTYDRDLVLAAAGSLLRRVGPVTRAAAPMALAAGR